MKSKCERLMNDLDELCTGYSEKYWIPAWQSRHAELGLFHKALKARENNIYTFYSDNGVTFMRVDSYQRTDLPEGYGGFPIEGLSIFNELACFAYEYYQSIPAGNTSFGLGSTTKPKLRNILAIYFDIDMAFVDEIIDSQLAEEIHTCNVAGSITDLRSRLSRFGYYSYAETVEKANAENANCRLC